MRIECKHEMFLCNNLEVRSWLMMKSNQSQVTVVRITLFLWAIFKCLEKKKRLQSIILFSDVNFRRRYSFVSKMRCGEVVLYAFALYVLNILIERSSFTYCVIALLLGKVYSYGLQLHCRMFRGRQKWDIGRTGWVFRCCIISSLSLFLGFPLLYIAIS